MIYITFKHDHSGRLVEDGLSLDEILEEQYEEERAKYRSQNRYRIDPIYRFKHLTRTRIRESIKDKQLSSSELLGCSGEEAYQHLVSQFTDDMTEDAFMNGDIHIDHIRPISSFDLTDEMQQRECFNYTNLQPLWAEDNLKKGSKIPGEIKDLTTQQ